MRDAAIIPLNTEESLVFTSDNSGGIGPKEHDHVKVPYETVSYYSFRVAVMECISAGARPVMVNLHNFCGPDAWPELKTGVERGLKEIGCEEAKLIGSTESNFSLLQSAVGVIVTGRRKNKSVRPLKPAPGLKAAVIGYPLVGEEVIEKNEQIAPLSLFRWFSMHGRVRAVWPVGSKGILAELNRIFPGITIKKPMVNLHKSSGPSTCFISVYEDDAEKELREKAGGLFQSLEMRVP